MSAFLTLTHADLVLPDRTERNCPITIADGRITHIGATPIPASQRRNISLAGRVLLPGLIDIHNDAIEKLVEPRPNVYFPVPFAIRECDQRLLAAGITTAFHAIAFAGQEFGVRDPQMADRIARALCAERTSLRRRLHVRYELTDADSVPLVEALINEGHVDLISFMDHSPGQGQYARRGSYMRYLIRTYSMTEREARKLIAAKRDNRESRPHDIISRLVSAAQSRKIPIAAHDLDNGESVVHWHELGASISEFPMNDVSVKTSRAKQMSIVMGAPNVVRGTSSGNGLRAIDVVSENHADILCSDYMPGCLLPALFQVSSELAIPLEKTISLATWRPAEAIGLTGVGKLEVGCLADLIVVLPTPHGPQLEAVMVDGQWCFLRRDFSNSR